jgi:hypothetical protein
LRAKTLRHYLLVKCSTARLWVLATLLLVQL